MHVFLGIKKKIRKDCCFSEITSLLNRAQAQPRLRVLFIRYLNIYIYIYIFFFRNQSIAIIKFRKQWSITKFCCQQRRALGHDKSFALLNYSSFCLLSILAGAVAHKSLKAKRIHPLNFNINCTTTPFWQIQSFLA